MPRKKNHQLRVQLSLRAAPDRVWAALVEVEQIKKWWGAVQGRIELRKGGVWALAWSGGKRGFDHVLSGLIRSLQPKKRVRIEPLAYFNATHSAPRLLRMSFTLARGAA